MRDKDNYIFISYAHLDQQEVRAYVEDFSLTHNVWIDEEQLEVGALFSQEIAVAIENCACFIAFRSANYDNSEYCFKEISYAFNKLSNSSAIKVVVLEQMYDKDNLKCAKGLDLCLGQHNQIFSAGEALKKLSNDRDFQKAESFNPWRIEHVDNRSEYFKPENSSYRFAYNCKDYNLRMVGRDKELKKLHEFMDSDEMKAWTIITGPGGSGKSKLACTFADQMYNERWDVYYLSHHVKESLESLMHNMPRNNTLVVIDYVLGNKDIISEFLYAAWSQKDHKPKIRVLMLEREYSHRLERHEETDVVDFESSEPVPYSEIIGSEQMLSSRTDFSTFISDHENELEEIMYEGCPVLFRLEPLGEKNMIQIMNEYIQASSHDKLNLSDAEGKKLSNILSSVDKDNQRPIYALFIADAWMNNHQPKDWDRKDALSYVLKAERNIWQKVACLDKFDSKGKSAFRDTLTKLLGKVTFHGGLYYDKAKDVCNDEISLLEKYYFNRAGHTLKGYLDDIGIGYRRKNGLYIDSIQPDLIGEWLVLEYLINKNKAPDLFGNKWYLNSGITQFVLNILSDFEDDIINRKDVCDIIFDGDVTFENEEEAKKYVSFLLNVSATLKKEGQDKAVNALKDIYSNNESFEMAAVYSAALSRKCWNFEKQTERKDAVEIIRTLYVKYINSPKAEKLAETEALSMLPLFNNSNQGDKDKILERLWELYESFPKTFGIAYSLSASLRDSITPVTQSNKKTEILRTIQKIYSDSENNRQIAHNFAIALTRCTVNNTFENNEEIIRKIRKLFKDHHFEDIARAFASALYGFAYGSTPEHISKCLQEIREIYKDFHNKDIAIILSSCVALHTYNNSIDGIKKCIGDLKIMCEEFPVSEIATKLSHALFNLSSKLPVEEAIVIIEQIKDLYEKYNNEYIAEDLSEALFNLADSSTLVGKAASAQGISYFYKEHKVANIAKYLVKTLCIIVDDEHFLLKGAVVQIIRNIYKEIKNEAIGEHFAYALYTASKSPSFEYVDTCAKEIFGIYKDFKTEYIAYQLCLALTNQIDISVSLEQSRTSRMMIHDIYYNDFRTIKIAAALCQSLVITNCLSMYGLEYVHDTYEEINDIFSNQYQNEDIAEALAYSTVYLARESNYEETKKYYELTKRLYLQFPIFPIANFVFCNFLSLLSKCPKEEQNELIDEIRTFNICDVNPELDKLMGGLTQEIE